MRQLWTRAAVIALTAGTLAACESTGGAQYPTTRQAPTPNFPIVQAPVANQQPEGPSTPPEEPQPNISAPTSSVGVSSQALAPVATAEPPPPPPPPPVEYRPAPTPPPRPVVVTTVAGPVVAVSGPRATHTVKAGDAIDAIARGMGTTRADLVKDNGLKSPYRIHPGDVLKGPQTDAKAYVVQTGDTMFAIAKRFSVSAAALADENDLSTGAAIKKGQKLRLPSGYKDRGPTKTTVMQAVTQGPSNPPPIGSQAPGRAPASSQPAYTPAPSRAPVEEPEAPSARPVTTTTTSVTGSVVEVAGPRRTYTVKSGDAIDAIARGLDTTRADLVKDNDLDAPYRIKPGQKLKGPATTAKAYVANGGDTLANVAKRFNVKPGALAEENNLRTSATLKKGQKVRLPSGYKDKGPLKTTTTSVTGSVVEVAGPRRTYTVKAGDAIDAIARGLDTTRADLVEDNKLKAPYRIHPGQKLKGPATTAKAYVAQSGDTLANIAKRFNVKPAALADENDIKVSATIKKGQKIRLPSGYKDKGPLKTTTTTTPAAPRPTTPRPTTPEEPSYNPPIATKPPAPYQPPVSQPRPYTPPPVTNYPRPTGPVSAQPVAPPASSGQIIAASPPPTEAEITAAGRGRFVWPLRGDTISDFGPKGTGQRNDGVNIRAAAGTPVRAAAAGEVVYAGNQVPGFGNLVLVKHADGWVTAYAHLSSTEVKMRQQVSQGDTLGEVGQTGGVTEPQLHFEVRYAPTPKDKARPVDPGLVLPR